MAGLYIHIPYCARKCLYCDFYSGGARIADWNALETALANELKTRIQELGQTPDIRTVYFGGGTPSLMPIDNLQRLSDVIYGYAKNTDEITIEVNPDDVTSESAKSWHDIGINRVSMGVQSFNDAELRALGRRHTSDRAIKAYETLTGYFSNISIDLIYDIPGQTNKSWAKTIDTALSLSPKHISSYNMMYEPNTAITLMREAGRIRTADEEEIIRWFNFMTDRLTGSGYEYYEISNFAKPGYRSQHNSQYWNHSPYLGLGPSAHSYDGGRIRRANPADIKGYIHHFKYPTEDIFYKSETLKTDELFEETVMLGLRTAEGIDLYYLKRNFPEKLVSHLIERSERHIRNGHLILTSDNRLHLSREGVLLSDAIILDLV